MPRKIIGRKPKGKLKNWDAQSMMKAIVSVREKKMGLRKAVKLYEVPQTSLQRFINSDKTPEERVNLKVGRKPVLPANLETELVEYLIEMDDRFYGLRRDDDVDFLPSESSSQTEAIPSPDVNIQSPPSTRLQFSDHSSCASTPAAQNDRDAGIPYNPFRLSDVDLQEAGLSNQPTTYVSLRHIMPVPAPKRKTSNRGRKPSSAAVITSSPYKMELEKALNNAKKLPRKGKSKTRQLKPCNRKFEFKEKSDSDSISSGKSVMEMPVGEMPAEEDDAL
ncbi:helix-turn-helix psq domain [Holotrichia oblita]|uniref:Helix-turn-helix psq domain n=1 Tax=Holotrichia oblita TaxID=644536 RepID=A0ACB9SH52_HOLOL|nr:helix-turn-helix psq domain [Holotrichia oblita]